MAFCKYCGSELQDGQLCGCDKAVASREVKEAPAQEKTAEAVAATTAAAPVAANAQGAAVVQEVKNVALKTVGNIVNLIKAPVTAGAEFIKKADAKEAVTLVVLQAICAAIFACVLVGLYNKGLGDYEYVLDMKFSGVKIFVFTVLFSLITSLVLAACNFVFFKLCKVAADWMMAVKVLAVRAAVLAPALLVAVVLFAMNEGMGIVFYMATVLLTAVLLYTGLSAVEGVGKNKAVYAAFIITIISVVVIWILANKGFGLYAPEAYVESKATLSDLMGRYY